MKTQFLTRAVLPLALLPIAGTFAKNAKKEKMNVLLLLMDDLRPELNCYGHSDIISPNIDKLSAEGVQFNQAYCNIPVSGASRASLMTGLRPTMNRFYDVESKIEVDAPGIETLPKYLKENGYLTYSFSKIIHDKKDAADSWSDLWYPNFPGKTWRNYLGKENLDNDGVKHGPAAYECEDVADDKYVDGMTANKTIEQLRALKKSGKPFFLASGIVKPHLPFNAPKKYWDLYNFDNVNLPANYDIDRTTFPAKAFHTWGELRFYKNIPDAGKIQDDAEARRLIMGYKACVSFADAQVGKILDELKKLGLDKNTVVVLVGDHGWSLGDHGDWCKHSNFSIVNNTAMIIKAPGLPANKKIDQMVELVDIYPTVCSLVGLPAPTHTEGADMSRLMKGTDKNWKNYAIIKWHDGLTYMTPEYRYTEWINKKDAIVDRMLFNYKSDKPENANLANDASYQDIMNELSTKMRAERGKDFLSPVKK